MAESNPVVLDLLLMSNISDNKVLTNYPQYKNANIASFAITN